MATIICIASGPSLNEHDCRLVANSGLPVIAVNNSWQLLPGATIFASDLSWWNEYGATVPTTAERWTTCPLAAQRHQLLQFKSCFLTQSYNSGQLAIELAVTRGARRVLLLGYDCSLRAGTHWHGNHENIRNPTADSVKRWRDEFARLQQWAAGIEIINCSRETALKIFPRSTIEAEL
ncbi:hypothetical protein CJP72_18315 [Citrobacter sp. NCU1]|uniref:hypothetical protein n=1 Tax=Citrobacter sp. NCU1 TaxID=2026683 RepID=UPI001391A9AE|nr:hypothetical protein [Citrobacter sp. NCU1]NDO82655.1 hypothetical protein [Citrobacter sp. NCU1]